MKRINHMKSYPSISGPQKFLGRDCIAFEKYDGSNIRVEWSRKRGWFKFGSRNRLFDKNDEQFGIVVDLFHQTYGDSLISAVKNIGLRAEEGVVAFLEYFGPNSFAGQHDPKDKKELILFDLNMICQGFMTPKEFVQLELPKAKVVYEGSMNQEFIDAIKRGDYVGNSEGVVAKGIWSHPRQKVKNERHGLWMAKIKTAWWLGKLSSAIPYHPALQSVLRDNVFEQGVHV